MTDRENYYVCNMGVGYVLILPENDLDEACKVAKKYGLETYELGHVEIGPRKVVMPFKEKGNPVVYKP